MNARETAIANARAVKIIMKRPASFFEDLRLHG